MSHNSKIEWCDATWNPIAGCTKCSPGCLNCYAERFAYRLACMGQKKYQKVISTDGGVWNNKIYCDESILDQPLHWPKPKRIFVCSMSDLFHEKVPFEFIDKVLAVMSLCFQHTFLILTKRAKRMLEYFTEDIEMGFNRDSFIEGQAHKILCEKMGVSDYEFHAVHFPLPNVHLGVSISTRDEMWKAEVLADIPAAVRFISFEPLLEDIIDIPVEVMNKIDGCIIGCESGPGRRDFDNNWVLGLVADFHHFNKPVFVKQININGKVVKMPKEYPQELPERK